MVFNGVIEMRSLPYLTLSNTLVTADETICAITGAITNNDVTFPSLQVCFADAGKLYIEDTNGNKMYLTDYSRDFSAKTQILSTFMMPKGETWLLKYSANTTLYNLIVVLGGSVF